jgi:hypothetical protein
MLSRPSPSRQALLPALLLAFVASTPAAGLPAQSAGDPVNRLDHAAIERPSLRLPAPVRSEAAVRLLGPRLNEVAARYGGTGANLAAILRRDPDLLLDTKTRLVYSCRFNSDAENAQDKEPTSEVGAAPFPLDQSFELHSLPESKRVVYLDFNGHVTSGTEWNRGTGDIKSVPWSLDADRSSFNNTELIAIQNIWQGVAEDYASFDVDVTTQDPGVERLRRSGSTDELFGVRVVVSPTDYFNPGAGGVAYVGSFAWSSDTPCFAFTDGLDDDPKAINEASSHEVGHTLGLSHDGIVRGTGYYQGHGNWAPIMGVGYYRPVTQWSRGEYANANNHEDDLAIMPIYGASQRLDDVGNTAATATALVPGVDAAGVIGNRTDVDFFSFQFPGGPIAVHADPAPLSPDLNIKLSLFSADNQLIAEAAGGPLSQQLGETLAAGTYFLRIDGEGEGTPTSGYSDYASIGQYTLKVSLASTISGAVKDPSGAGVPGTQILLKNSAGNLVSRTTTNVAGAFNLTDLVAGRYALSALNASYVIAPGVVSVVVPPSRADVAFTATAIPIKIVSLKVRPSKVRGGRTARGTLNLSVPAGVGGVTVQLTCDKTEKATPPDTLIVPTGATTVDFDIATSKVRKRTAIKITAAAGNSTQTARLTLF